MEIGLTGKKEKLRIIKELFEIYESKGLERPENFYNERFDKLYDKPTHKLKQVLESEKNRLYKT